MDVQKILNISVESLMENGTDFFQSLYCIFEEHQNNFKNLEKLTPEEKGQLEKEYRKFVFLVERNVKDWKKDAPRKPEFAQAYQEISHFSQMLAQTV